MLRSRALERANDELDEAISLYQSVKQVAEQVTVSLEAERMKDVAPDFPVTVGEENKL